VGDAGDDDAPELVEVGPVDTGDTGGDVGANVAAVSGAVVVLCAAAGPASEISSGSAIRNGWVMAPVRA
jgi:hypothetical protein